MARQFNRVYSLVVGTKDDAIEINNLHITFDVVKTSSNKDRKNSAWVEIYNLSEGRRRSLEQPYVQVRLKVGYVDTGLYTLFSGQVVNISTSKVTPYLSKRSGADIVTRLEIDEFYTELNGEAVSRIVPEGRTVKTVIEEVVKELEGVTKTRYGGNNIHISLPNGYPAYGTPRQILDNLSEEYDIEWQIDDSVLYVSDVGGSYMRDRSGVPLIGQTSGLIGRPEFINEDARRLRRQVKGKTPKYSEEKQNHLRLKILLNPTIVAGSIVKLDFDTLSGYYKVTEVTHKGGYRDIEWSSTLSVVAL